MISPESRGGPNIALITIVCGWTFLVIALLGVSILLWFRRIKEVHLGLDDYMIILALATAVALIAQTTWAIADEDQDKHEAEISKTKFALVVRSLLVNQTLWGLVNTFIRMSAVLFIERVFKGWGNMKLIARALLVLSILYGLVVFLEVFLICRSMAVDWNAYVDGTCGDQTVSYLILEVLGLLLDLSILALPFPHIWKLVLPRAKKMSISIYFSIGVLLFIITGLRIQALRMVVAQDFSYSKGYLGLLSTLGASLGIIVYCTTEVPRVYHLWREWRERAVQVDEEITVPFETLNDISLPMTEETATQTHGSSARWSLDGNVAGAEPPPYGRLQKHRTF